MTLIVSVLYLCSKQRLCPRQHGIGDYPDRLSAVQKRLAVPVLKNATRIAQRQIHKGGYAPLAPGGRPCQTEAFISFVSGNDFMFCCCCLLLQTYFCLRAGLANPAHACTWAFMRGRGDWGFLLMGTSVSKVKLDVSCTARKLVAGTVTAQKLG